MARPGACPTEAPPPPAGLSGAAMDCREVWLSWVQTFDNQTAQASIRYDIFVNGLPDHSQLGIDEAIVYGTMAGDNTFTVIAFDAAGNASAPADTVVTLC